MCSYYSQWAHENIAPRSQPQWDAFKFCRAVKRRAINGSCTIPTKDGQQVIRPENVGFARTLFGTFIRNVLRQHYGVEILLVPVPSKDGLEQSKSFRSLDMTIEAMPEPLKSLVDGCVRFTQQLQPANAGGPRGKDALLPYMKTNRRLDGERIVIIDDILTTGGSVQATIQKIEDAGGVVIAAIVCGYTVSDSIRPPFGAQEVDLVIQDDLF